MCWLEGKSEFTCSHMCFLSFLCARLCEEHEPIFILQGVCSNIFISMKVTLTIIWKLAMKSCQVPLTFFWFSLGHAVIATLACPLPYNWNKRRPKQPGTPVRHFVLNQSMWGEKTCSTSGLSEDRKPSLSLDHTSSCSLYKTTQTEAFALCLLALHSLASPCTVLPRDPCTDVRACFFGIRKETEGQLRQPASWTKQLFNSWIFYC